MALNVNDIVRVTWRAGCYNQLFQFQQHYRVLSADGALGVLQSLFAIANYFGNNVLYGGPSTLTNSWLAMLANTVQTYSVEAQRLLPSKTIYIANEAAISGTGGTGPKQTNTCASFSLVSGIPGRKQVAKYHIGPIPDSFAVNGALSTAALTALRNLAQACVPIQTLTAVAANDTTLQPCIFHRSVNVNPRTDDVSTYRINFYVRTQRRRTINVGR